MYLFFIISIIVLVSFPLISFNKKDLLKVNKDIIKKCENKITVREKSKQIDFIYSMQEDNKKQTIEREFVNYKYIKCNKYRGCLEEAMQSKINQLSTEFKKENIEIKYLKKS